MEEGGRKERGEGGGRGRKKRREEGEGGGRGGGRREKGEREERGEDGREGMRHNANAIQRRKYTTLLIIFSLTKSF